MIITYIVLWIVAILISAILETLEGKRKVTIKSFFRDFFLGLSYVFMFLLIESTIIKLLKENQKTEPKKEIETKIDSIFSKNDTTYIYILCRQTQEN